MFCSWCGLESENSDVCSWRRKPFATQSVPEQPQDAAASPSVSKASSPAPPAQQPLEAIPIKRADAPPPAPKGIPIAPQTPFVESDEDLPPLPRSPQPLRPLA